MLKRLSPALIVAMMGAVAAQAQEPSACIRAAYDLAQVVEAKDIASNKLDRIEDLLNKMEDLCDSDKVDEAMSVAKDIEAEMNAQ